MPNKVPAPRCRVLLTTDNYCHKPLSNGEAVEGLIVLAAEGEAAVRAWQAAGGNIDIAAGSFKEVSALHALARNRSCGSTPRGQQDRRALRTLLAVGADMKLKNRRGETAFHRAVVTGGLWYVTCVQEHGMALWDETDSRGQTPLEARRAHLKKKGPASDEDVAMGQAFEKLRAAARQNRLDERLPSTEPSLAARASFRL